MIRLDPYVVTTVLSAPGLLCVVVVLVLCLVYLDHRLEQTRDDHDHLAEAYDQQVADNEQLRAENNALRDANRRLDAEIDAAVDFLAADLAGLPTTDIANRPDPGE